MAFYDDLVLGGTEFRGDVFGQNDTGAFADALIFVASFVGGVGPVGGTVPDPPTDLVASIVASGSVLVTFNAPVNDGGSAILGYTVTPTVGPGVDSNAGSSSLSHLVTGNTNGVPVAFTAHATNILGDSVESAPSNTLSPSVVMSFILVNTRNVPVPNLTGLKVAFFEAAMPHLITAGPTDVSAVETTDVTGRLIVPLPGSSFASGDVGWANVTNSTGVPVQDDPVFDEWCGPVRVS